MYFCGEEGGSFENCNISMPVREQVWEIRLIYTKKYNAKKFIVYFQNFTNTYLGIEDFKKMIADSIVDEDIIGISLSTRPDCILEDNCYF